MNLTVADVLAPALATRPDAPALVARSGTLTYCQLDEAADAAAGALWELGVRPGDRVGACLPNDLDIVVAFHGALRIGAIWLGIAEAYARDEQEELVALSRPSVVVAGANSKIESMPIIEVGQWAQLTGRNLRAPQVAVQETDPAGIAFTSGTTGRPKGVVHSHRNLLLPGSVLVSTRRWGPELRKGDSLPMTILNMLVLSTLTTAQAQGCSILIDRRDVGGIAEQIAEHEVSVWNGAPAQIYDLARRPELDFGSLHELWSGGGDCPEELRRRVLETHKLHVHSTYGLTEAPTVVSIDPVNGQSRDAAVGAVLPHLTVAACDDEGQRLAPGEIGELRLEPATDGRWAGRWRPPLGLWQDGQIVPHVPAGAVMTGDIGTVSEDGWVTIVDRKKLVIVRGGANVYPAEIERVIRLCQGISEVAVIGVPDARLGERVAALVACTDEVDGDDLSALCREHLAAYKVPEVWGRVEQFRTNAMGKINRAGLIDLLPTALPFGRNEPN